MEQIISILHVLAALAIIGLIMLQQGKGADMGASFGAGGSQTLFGSTGSGNALTKATALFVTVFFLTSFGLAIVAKSKASIGVEDLSIPVVVESAAEPVGDVPVDEPAGDLDIPVPATDSADGGDIPEI